jgi:hypothetical protein
MFKLLFYKDNVSRVVVNETQLTELKFQPTMPINLFVVEVKTLFCR